MKQHILADYQSKPVPDRLQRSQIMFLKRYALHKLVCNLEMTGFAVAGKKLLKYILRYPFDCLFRIDSFCDNISKLMTLFI